MCIVKYEYIYLKDILISTRYFVKRYNTKYDLKILFYIILTKYYIAVKL